VREVLDQLPDGARVLDLGCGDGGFSADPDTARIVRVDLERKKLDRFVQADAAKLPFASRSFDAVVSNHSLEHIDALDDALREIGRVIKPGALLYIAVPDASTITDRIYRWLGRGGGHVNAFTSARDLAARVERFTGLKCVGTRTLLTSLAFMNRHNIPGKRQRKLLLFGGGSEAVLRVATHFMRRADRFIGTRLSVYGWALFFGEFHQVDTSVRSNVCVRCGSAHSSALLGPAKSYACPACGTRNLFTDDRYYQAME
jgi:SAM-dependent methyltransferase/DNA-directed RNA polymerase subunit RPC12/RpoP